MPSSTREYSWENNKQCQDNLWLLSCRSPASRTSPALSYVCNQQQSHPGPALPQILSWGRKQDSKEEKDFRSLSQDPDAWPSSAPFSSKTPGHRCHFISTQAFSRKSRGSGKGRKSFEICDMHVSALSYERAGRSAAYAMGPSCAARLFLAILSRFRTDFTLNELVWGAQGCEWGWSHTPRVTVIYS